MSKNVLWVAGIDPGLSTGLFVVRTEYSPINNQPMLPAIIARYQGQPGMVLEKLEHMIRQAALWQEGVYLAGERYTTTDQTGKRSSQPLPLRVLGSAEQLSYSYANVEFVLQQPADAKKLAPNDFLRDAGFYSTGGDVSCPDANDVNDAARHVLLALARKRASIFDLVVAGVEHRRGHSQR